MLKLLAERPGGPRPRRRAGDGAPALGGLRPARFPQDRARASRPAGRAHLHPSERGRRPHPAGLVCRARSRGSTMSRATSTRSPTGSPAVRTWAYIAHRADWLAEPAAMAERTMAVEEKLSDALHERLTQRFVDRRTAVLMRDLGKKGAGEFPVLIDAEGEVSVGSYAIGRLQGFAFEVDPAARHADRKMLLATAERRLGGEYEKRAAALVADSDDHFSLRTEAGAPVAILWRGHEVARLGPGQEPAQPAHPARPADRPRLRQGPRGGDRAPQGLAARRRRGGARPAARRRPCRAGSGRAGAGPRPARHAGRRRRHRRPRRRRRAARPRSTRSSGARSPASASGSARSTCSCRRC